MAGRLHGKVAIVTGAGSGIGRATAVAYAAEGARVVLAELVPERGETVAEQIRWGGGEALVLPVDVTDGSAVQALVARTVEAFGSADVLVHSAANVPLVNDHDARLTELPDEIWDRILGLFLTGTFNVCKHVGRQMLRQGSGSIVLVSTTDALVGVAGLDAYTAAKGGVTALTRSFAAGMAPDGVRVNAICPSFVSSEPQQAWLADASSHDTIDRLHLLPIATPEDIAPLAVYLGADESRVVTGGVFPIDSGYTAFKARLDVMGAMRVEGEVG
ncbi:SDR family NAD(P)-dependent oxidoreductase [Conexibacter stalactiti]|uniref:SDR family NAD(P)-dependent oxidoreductase n=1 Tax=Conexibacter stalactiti TaxID=1940611 RepID=A0ABU4HS47_9ACTN|nr:SDR family NAD(P)-dependent oxidoreductase [Conexibacter stalactiti]MDW5596133.1 SDR family NAD(P)-dependent oxidoreductase [Conexibacter stalactiti]MEC5036775.1 SDR family NAD(P)-dependent oxidoreductase [Conexibacter stalactiti]